MLKQTHPWSCLTACLAALTFTNEEDVFTMIGHDGSEIVHPENEGWLKHRGFDPTEIVIASIKLNRPLVMLIPEGKVEGLRAEAAILVEGDHCYYCPSLNHSEFVKCIDPRDGRQLLVDPKFVDMFLLWSPTWISSEGK